MDYIRKLKNKTNPEIQDNASINNNNPSDTYANSALDQEVAKAHELSVTSRPEELLETEKSNQKTVTELAISSSSDIPCDEITAIEESPTPSLLQNRPFIKLVEELCNIMKEFDSYSNRVQTDEAKIIVNQILEQLQESLERSGLTRFENENTFSIIRHIPVPMANVKEGENISETLSPGLLIENRIFRKAKVRISKSTL